jgi:hypothetical protein
MLGRCEIEQPTRRAIQETQQRQGQQAFDKRHDECHERIAQRRARPGLELRAFARDLALS